MCFTYILCLFQTLEKLPEDTKIINFDLLRSKAKTKEEFLKWLRDFESKSLTTWRVRKVIKSKGVTVVYKVST